MLLLAALAFKLGAFPFHSWAPDAYETAPPAVAAFLAAVPKIAALLAIADAARSACSARRGAVWSPLVAGLAVASIVFGNLAALRQTSFRRMLAYSGIAQVGYALVGVAVGARGRAHVVLFGVVYALAAAGAFLAAEAAGEGDRRGTARIAGAGRARQAAAAARGVARRVPAVADGHPADRRLLGQVPRVRASRVAAG